MGDEWIKKAQKINYRFWLLLKLKVFKSVKGAAFGGWIDANTRNSKMPFSRERRLKVFRTKEKCFAHKSHECVCFMLNLCHPLWKLKASRQAQSFSLLETFSRKGFSESSKSEWINCSSHFLPASLPQDRPCLQGEEELWLHAAGSRSRLHRLRHPRYCFYNKTKYSAVLTDASSLCVAAFHSCAVLCCGRWGGQMYFTRVRLLWCQPLGAEGDQEAFVCVWDCECCRKWTYLTH